MSVPETSRRARASTAQEASSVYDHEQKANEGEQEASKYEQLKEALAPHTAAIDHEGVDAPTMSRNTVNKRRKRLNVVGRRGEHEHVPYMSI